MKTITSLPKLGISAIAFVMLFVVSAAGAFAQGGQNPTSPTPQPAVLSQGETAGVEKVKAAADANAAMAAAADFIKTYPTSAARGEVGDQVAAKIMAITDPAQRAAASDKMLVMFTGVDEVDGLFDGLGEKQQFDEMFRLGAARVDKVPGEVKILTQLALVGSEQLRQKNKKYSAQAETYGLKAIALIEAGSKPAPMTDAAWDEYKKKLPALYQCIASIQMTSQKLHDAQKSLQKVLALGAADAYTYLGLGDISNEDYRVAMEDYQAKAGSPEGPKLKTKAINLLTQTMDLYDTRLQCPKVIHLRKKFTTARSAG